MSFATTPSDELGPVGAGRPADGLCRRVGVLTQPPRHTESTRASGSEGGVALDLDVDELETFRLQAGLVDA